MNWKSKRAVVGLIADTFDRRWIVRWTTALLTANAAMLGLTAWILGPTTIGFHVTGFWPAVWGGVIFAVAGFFARRLVADER